MLLRQIFNSSIGNPMPKIDGISYLYPHPPRFTPLLSWDPSSIPGIEWFDFSDANFRTDVSGDVSQIDDKNGGANFYEQTTAADRPRVSTVNGLDAAEFGPDSDEVLEPNGFGTFPANGSVFVVADITGTPGTSALLGFGASDYLHARSTTGTFRWTTPTTSFTSSDITVVTAIILDFTGANNCNYYVNGAQSSGSFDPAGAHQTTVLSIGNSITGGGFATDGDICEFVRNDSGSFTAAERASLFGYAAQKWGVVLT